MDGNDRRNIYTKILMGELLSRWFVNSSHRKIHYLRSVSGIYSCMIIHWLVVWNMFIFHNIWDNPSHLPILFKIVKTTNQIIFYFSIYWDCHHPNWQSPSLFRGVGWNHQPDPQDSCFISLPSGYVKIAIENDPLILDLSISSMMIFHSYVNVSQRVSQVYETKLCI